MRKYLGYKFYFIFISVLIILMSVFIFRKFLFDNKYYVFMDLGGDTLGNYLPNLWYLISQIQRGSLPLWSFNIGIGTSIFSLSSLFIDIFFLVYLLFSKVTFLYAFVLVAILKVLVTGVLFYCFIKYYLFDNLTNIILTMLYAFNSYLLVWGQHYGFASMFVYFTFVLFALERYINTNRYILLIFAIASFLANSIYFVFMAVFLYVPYFYFRLHFLKKLTKPIQQTVIVVIIFIIGLLLSAFSLYPSVIDMLNSPRVSSSFSGIRLFFPLRVYFGQVATIYINWIDYMVHPDWTNSYENSKYFISLLFPLIIPLFIFDIVKRKNYKLILISILCLLPLVFPFFYLIIYRFVAPIYPKFRFTFIYIPLEVLSIGYVLKSVVITYKGVITALIINFTVILFMAFYIKHLGQVINYRLFIEITIYLLAYGFLLPNKSTIFRILLIILLFVELGAVNSQVEYKDRINLTKDYAVNHKGYYDETDQVNQRILAIDNGFYRIDKGYTSGSWNDAQFQNYYGFITYNSLNTPSYLKLMDALNPSGYLYNPLNHSAKNYNILLGFGDNLPLYTLMTQKYFISRDSLVIPFGYSLLFESNNYRVYQNKYFLPVSSFYPISNCINSTMFEKLSISQKTSVLYSSYVSNYCDNDNNKIFIESDLIIYHKIPNDDYIVSNENGTMLESEIFKSGPTSSFISFKYPESYLNVKVIIKTDKPINGAVYVKIGDNSLGENAVIHYNVSDLGTQEINLNLPFQNIRQLRFDINNIENNHVSLKHAEINRLDYANYIRKVSLLKENTVNTMYNRQTPNVFTGKLYSNESGMLVFYIPFDKNWHAEVNGHTVKLESVNIGFVGLPVNVGSNNYKLYYKNKAFFIGAIISALVLFLMVLLYLVFKFNFCSIFDKETVKK